MVPGGQHGIFLRSQSKKSHPNEIEAGHRTVFVAGWRPFIGWVCGVALAYNFVIRDLFIWITKTADAPPALQMEHLMTVLLGMLGLGGLRTFEKVKDKTK